MFLITVDNYLRLLDHSGDDRGNYNSIESKFNRGPRLRQNKMNRLYITKAQRHRFVPEMLEGSCFFCVR